MSESTNEINVIRNGNSSAKPVKPALKPRSAPSANPKEDVAARGTNQKSGKKSGSKRFLFMIIATLVLAVIAGFGIARYFQAPWFEFKSPDNDYAASFRQEPLLLRVAVTNDWSDEMMQTVTVRGFWGLDELNRLTGIRAADGDRRWLDEMLKQAGAELKSGDPADFNAYLPRENVWMRGRIMFSPQGGALYRVWILRVTEDELNAPSSIRFLYSFKFTGQK